MNTLSSKSHKYIHPCTGILLNNKEESNYWKNNTNESQNLMLSKRNQIQNNTQCIILFICNSKTKLQWQITVLQLPGAKHWVDNKKTKETFWSDEKNLYISCGNYTSIFFKHHCSAYNITLTHSLFKTHMPCPSQCVWSVYPLVRGSIPG